jgi:hypothetical protein
MKGMGLIFGRIKRAIQGISKTILFKAKDIISGLMGESIWAFSIKEKKAESGSIFGPMEEFIWGFGKMENNMAWECILMKAKSSCLALG